MLNFGGCCAPKQPLKAMEEKQSESKADNQPGLTVLQWNPWHIGDVEREFIQALSAELQLKILCIQEVASSRQRIRRIRGFHYPFISENDDTKPICIYIRKDLLVEKIKRKSDTPGINIQGVRVHLYRGHEVDIWNVYIHPNVPLLTRKEFWNNWPLDPQRATLICGDFNEPSELLGSFNTRKTFSMSEFIETYDLSILNNGSTTRIQVREGQLIQSALDVTLCSNPLEEYVQSWDVVECHLADHFPIITTIDASPEMIQNVQVQKTNFKKLTKKFKQLYHESKETGGDRFIESIHNLKEVDARHQKKYSSCTWWDDELRTIKFLRNKALRRKDFARFKSLKRTFRKLYRQKRRAHKRKLLSSIANDPNPWNALSKAMPETRFKKTPPLNLDVEEEKSFVERLAKTYQKIMYNLRDETINVEDYEEKVQNTPPIADWEIKAAVATTKERSAPGLDGISYLHIKKLLKDPEIFRWFADSVQDWVHRTFPSIWKHAKIIPIPKGISPEKGYRPISLLACIGKIVEKIIARRIQELIDPYLPANQAGCRAGRTAQECVMRALHASSQAHESNHDFGIVLIDLSKAFDSAKRTAILDNMERRFYLPAYLVAFVARWLCDRTFSVHSGSTKSATYKTTRGIPQGSSLSVQLWLVFVSTLPLRRHNSAVFMDDIAMWATGRSNREVLAKLQDEIKDLESWCDSTDMSISPTKCHLLLNDNMAHACVYIKNVCVRSTNRARYLGFHLTAKSGPNNQILLDFSTVASDIVKRTSVFRKLKKKLRRQELVMFGQGLVLSKLSYYLPLMAAEASTGALEVVKKALNKYMRVITGALPSTPIPILHSSSGIPDLETLINDSARRYYMSMSMRPGSALDLDFESWNGQGNASSPFKGLYETERNLPAILTTEPLTGLGHLDHLCQEVVSNLQFDIASDREEAKDLIEQGGIISHEGINVYTDGTFRPRSEQHERATACGWVIFEGSVESKRGCNRVDPPFSSYSAEINGMLLAIEDLTNCLGASVHGKMINIYCDSRGLLQHMESLARTAKRVNAQTQDLCLRLRQLNELGPRGIKLIWIPGHIGVKGNTIADEMATTGYDSPDLFTTMTPPSYFKTWSRECKKDEFESYLRKNVKDSASPSVPTRDRWKHIRHWNKEMSVSTRFINVSLFRIRCGHSNTNSHFNRFRKANEKKDCRYCKSADETPEHILLECTNFHPRDWTLRTDFKQYCLQKWKTTKFNSIIMKQDRKMVKLLGRIMLSLREFGVVI